MQKIRNTIISNIRVPKNSLELIALTSNWNCLNSAEINYFGKNKNQGDIHYEHGSLIWNNPPFTQLFESKSKLILPSNIHFDKNMNPESVKEIIDNLIPYFIKEGYKLKSFSAEKTEIDYNRGVTPIKVASLLFYIDGLNKKWRGVVNFDKEKGLKELKKFKKYFIN